MYKNKENYLLIFFPIAILSGPLLTNFFVSIFSILGIYYCFKKVNQKFINNKFILIFIFFYILILFSSIISENQFLSLSGSLFYIRFIFFSLAIGILILASNKLVKNFNKVLYLTILIVCLDALFQYLTGENILNFPIRDEPAEIGRLSGIFGDELILGSFLSRLLPLLLALSFYTINILKLRNLVFFIVSYVLIFITIILSGERTAILFTVFNTLILYLCLPNKIKLFGIFLLPLLFSGVFFILNNNDDLKVRLINQTIRDIGIQEDGSIKPKIFSDMHEKHIIIGLNMFKESPLIGKGVKTFREECKKYKDLIDGCSTHPHHTYAQLLGETGILSFLIVLGVFLYIVINLFKKIILINKNRNFNKIFISEIFLLSSFFLTLLPFLPTANFFGSYINTFFYLPLGFYFGIITFKKISTQF